MAELFRYIQQAVVVPSDGEQIDLTADSRFQRDLLTLVRQPYSQTRTRADKFLNHVAGDEPGGSGNEAVEVDPDAVSPEEYGSEMLVRVGTYVDLHQRILALVTASQTTDDVINQAVKDVLGSYAGELVKQTAFGRDRNFASDVLVAVKILTRFDRLDVASITTMRRVIAFIEDLAVGRATTGWHPMQLAPPSTASSDSGVAALSRDADHMNVWWIGKDEKPMAAEWYHGGWSTPTALPDADGASLASGMAAVSRDADHMNVWWIAKDEKVMVAEWYQGEWSEPEAVPGATGASSSTGVVALSRSSAHMEVWWIGKDGSIRNAWWTEAEGWQVNPNRLATDASPSSGLTVLSRNPTHMEVWWVAKNLSVQGAWWIEGDGWQGPYQVAEPGRATASSGLAALSRTPTHMDVWWVDKDGAVQNSRWTKAGGWQAPRRVSNAQNASPTGGVVALARNSAAMRVWWIGNDRSIQEARWTSEGWQAPLAIAEANSASTPSGLAALSQKPTHMELWWIGKDRSVQDAWWLDPAAPITAAQHIRRLLQRAMRFPEIFLPPQRQAPAAQAQAPAAAVDQGHEPGRQFEQLTEREASFRKAYDTVLSLSPTQLEIRTTAEGDAPQLAGDAPQGDITDEPGRTSTEVVGAPRATLDSMDHSVTEHLREQLGDPLSASLREVLTVVKRGWLDASRQLAPLRRTTPTRVFRLGVNLFAVQEPRLGAAPAPLDEPVPDFSHAITRPIGVGDLLVVRQTLVGYEPADISHIENVLPGELLRRTTTREETTELTIIEETESTQSEERDTQTTDRNELVSESQHEAGQQSATTTDQTSTSSYGRLVENSKSNYARSVTDRAVNKLTQTVRKQRSQREKKVFTDRGMHQLDNSKGQTPVRGIYQWLDKKYQVKILNYGKRLMYDVVIPEPAAFLIDELKKAAQPENFQLDRPDPPENQWGSPLEPDDLDETNYAELAATYGVSGSVKPPPAEYQEVVAGTAVMYVENNTTKSYGEDNRLKYHYEAFKIKLPDGYKAISGYVTKTKGYSIGALPDPSADFFIGSKRVTFPGEYGVKSFTLDEAVVGEIACQVHLFPKITQGSYAINITCQRDYAFAAWQLDTHARIVAGYERQRTNYLDQLAKYQAAVRTQMAMGQGYSRDSSLERQELKKAFIHLLMAEHFGQVYIPTPNPTMFPPNPTYTKKWGAVTAFFERAFEWEHLMYTYYPYFWGRKAKWGELVLIQDLDPQFEAFLKAGAARVVIPVRPGFEGALAHYQGTGDVWMGEEIPDMFSKQYVSIIAEIKARNAAPGEEMCVEEWEVRLPTTLIVAREDNKLPEWTPVPCPAETEQ